MSSDLSAMRLKVALWQTISLNFLLFCLNEKEASKANKKIQTMEKEKLKDPNTGHKEENF